MDTATGTTPRRAVAPVGTVSPSPRRSSSHLPAEETATPSLERAASLTGGAMVDATGGTSPP